MKSIILNEVQLNMLRDYADDILLPVMSTLWNLASISGLTKEFTKVLKILEDCCDQDRETFMDNLCTRYDTRPVRIRTHDKTQEDKEKVLHFITLFNKYKVNGCNEQKIASLCEDKTAEVNFKICLALLSVNALVKSPLHFLKKYIFDFRINTPPVGITPEKWGKIQDEDVTKLVIGQILKWVKQKKELTQVSLEDLKHQTFMI